MTEPKAVVIDALRRGGSSILWNILQSHPRLCSPIYETGELLTEHIAPFSWLPAATAKTLAAKPAVARLARRYLHHRFERWKMATLSHPENRERAEGSVYTAVEVAASIPCFKGVNSDVELRPLLHSIYDDVGFVGLVRNGYAVCAGWMRRGLSAHEAGKRYARIVRKIVAGRETYPQFVLVHFEELLADPFATAHRLYRALELQPTAVPKLRLKSKRVLLTSGSYRPTHGREGRKYWLGPDEIRRVLRADIDVVQMSLLSPRDRARFERHAGAVMEELGYLKRAPTWPSAPEGTTDL